MLKNNSYGNLPKLSMQPVQVICDRCKNEYTVSNRSHTRSLDVYGEDICKDCLKKIDEQKRSKIAYPIVVEYCNRHNYKLLSTIDDIHNNQSQIWYICPEHGKQKIKLKSIKQDKQCYWCSRRIAVQKKNNTLKPYRDDILYSRLIDVCNNSKYKLITPKSELGGYKGYIKYECPDHGIKRCRAGNFINQRGCPECRIQLARQRYKLTQQQVIDRIEKCGGFVMNPHQYVNLTSKNLQITCPNCGDVFITSFDLFTQRNGQLCQKCKKKHSIAQIKISEILKMHNVNYIQQKWFEDCRDQKPLPFDFYLPAINTIIQFDGEQHFLPLYGDESFQLIKKHDKIKNEYCKVNGIKLYRIPYWELKNLQEIILDIINESYEDIV